MSIRDRLDEIPAGTRLLRDLRYLPDSDLADFTVDELEHAERWLRAAAYSATEGARRVRRHITERTEHQCSSSDPSTTAKSGTTAEPPTDDPPTTAPGSPSATTPKAPPRSS